MNTVARKGLKQDMPEVYAILTRFKLTLPEEQGVMLQNQKTGTDPAKTATAWVQQHENQVKSWLELSGGPSRSTEFAGRGGASRTPAMRPDARTPTAPQRRRLAHERRDGLRLRALAKPDFPGLWSCVARESSCRRSTQNENHARRCAPPVGESAAGCRGVAAARGLRAGPRRGHSPDRAAAGRGAAGAGGGRAAGRTSFRGDTVSGRPSAMVDAGERQWALRARGGAAASPASARPDRGA